MEFVVGCPHQPMANTLLWTAQIASKKAADKLKICKTHPHVKLVIITFHSVFNL
jgi:hypothetical protein